MDERDGFEERLRQAEARERAGRPGEGRGALPQGPWGIGFRAGVEVFSAFVVGVAGGWYLDRWLGTFPWLFLLGFVLGSVAGVLNLYRMFMPRRRPNGT